jgi:hypothetical protein
MFVKEQETIDIKVYYKQSGHRFLALTPKEIEQRIKDHKLTKSQLEEDFKVLTVTMEVLSWGDYNKFQDLATVLDNNGDRRFNYKLYKEMRLKKLIRGWDALDDEGKVIPANEKNIMSLVPSIGDAIVRSYDDESFYDEESEKN